MKQTVTCCNSDTDHSQTILTLVSLLKVISEENRLRILCILRDGEHCVCELMKHIPASQSLISHHLKDLRDADIIVSEKRGLNVFYSLTAKGKRITEVLFSKGVTI